MHKIFSDDIMQDKADAIREVLGLPDTPENKMTPPQMADVLLENFQDPGLVFKITNLKTNYSGFMIDPFFYEHYPFDSNHTGLDHNTYNKLKVNFNIEKMSYILQNDPEVLRGTEADYKARYTENYKCADSIIVNSSAQNPTPLNPLLFVQPDYSSPDLGLGMVSSPAFMSVYQSETSGLVYCFTRIEGLEHDETGEHTSNSFACRINRILKHCENKTVSIIFYRNNPDIYSVYVDDVFQFVDNRTLPGVSVEDPRRSIAPLDTFLKMSIGNYSDRSGNFGWRYYWEYAYPYDNSLYAAESFNLISMQYIK